MTVYVVMCGWGTCPSDSFDGCDSVFASRADAEAYISEQEPAGRSGPFYEIQEHELRGSGTTGNVAEFGERDASSANKNGDSSDRDYGFGSQAPSPRGLGE